MFPQATDFTEENAHRLIPPLTNCVIPLNWDFLCVSVSLW